jgi:thioredoxin reductase (NADPH)
MSEVKNVIIIGSGPAGFAAGLYLGRARLDPLMFCGEESGGQLMLTTEVENYPGFSKGILGPELMSEMRKQAERFGAKCVDKKVTRVDFLKQPFKVWIRGSDKEEEYSTKAVVIATGARARMLNVGEEKLLGRGVSTCAVCDAAFFRDKVTYVVGGGDQAMEDALALSRQVKSVTIIHRRSELRASQIMQKRVLEDNKDKVSAMWNSSVVGVKGEQKLEAIIVEDTKTHEKKELQADGLFLAIGHVPETEIFKDQVKVDEKGYLVTHLNGLHGETGENFWHKGYPTRTSVLGVFGAGDVVDFRYQQAVTAAGFGCMAALDVEEYLTGHKQSW